MQMYSEILELVTTREEQELWREETERLIESLYRTGAGNLEEVLAGGVRRKTAELVRTSLSESGAKKEDFLRGLKEALDNLRTVRLTVGFEPSEKTVGKITAWLKENAGTEVVLELVYDPSILGGAVVIYEGHWADHSLAKSLRKVFAGTEKTEKQAGRPGVAGD